VDLSQTPICRQSENRQFRPAYWPPGIGRGTNGFLQKLRHSAQSLRANAPMHADSAARFACAIREKKEESAIKRREYVNQMGELEHIRHLTLNIGYDDRIVCDRRHKWFPCIQTSK
jgi:hypothetical protein